MDSSFELVKELIQYAFVGAQIYLAYCMIQLENKIRKG